MDKTLFISMTKVLSFVGSALLYSMFCWGVLAAVSYFRQDPDTSKLRDTEVLQTLTCNPEVQKACVVVPGHPFNLDCKPGCKCKPMVLNEHTTCDGSTCVFDDITATTPRTTEGSFGVQYTCAEGSIEYEERVKLIVQRPKPIPRQVRDNCKDIDNTTKVEFHGKQCWVISGPDKSSTLCREDGYKLDVLGLAVHTCEIPEKCTDCKVLCADSNAYRMYSLTVVDTDKLYHKDTELENLMRSIARLFSVYEMPAEETSTNNEGTNDGYQPNAQQGAEAKDSVYEMPAEEISTNNGRSKDEYPPNRQQGAETNKNKKQDSDNPTQEIPQWFQASVSDRNVFNGEIVKEMPGNNQTMKAFNFTGHFLQGESTEPSNDSTPHLCTAFVIESPDLAYPPSAVCRIAQHNETVVGGEYSVVLPAKNDTSSDSSGGILSMLTMGLLRLDKGDVVMLLTGSVSLGVALGVVCSSISA